MLIIKIGGGATINHEAIIKDLANIKEPFLVVHGANALRDELAKKIGYKKQTITSPTGYSSVLTDAAGIDIFLMSYAGIRNKRLVEMAQKNGINAIGLTGLDGGLIRGERKKAIRAVQNGKTIMIRNDLSGKPNAINVGLIQTLLSSGYVPFICPPILSEEGEALNTENDSIVSLLIKELGNVTTIIHLFEAPGLLKNKDDELTLIPKITRAELEQAESEYTTGRMKRKMLAVREAFESGVERVIFADGRVENPISKTLEGKCTIIQ
ncbi:MAG: [LysW]-aminoadipate kinase [Patescibacteria group bacterium]